MAGDSRLCASILLVVFLFHNGQCQYRQIDLTTATCNMSSRYVSENFTSLDCRGAINGNNGTSWTAATLPGENCILTTNHDSTPYWQVNLGQTRDIHRIIIYPELSLGRVHMKNTRVLVDDVEVAKFSSVESQVENPLYITNVTRGRVIKLTQDAYIFLIVCEVQVEVPCDPGKYGQNCLQTCSAGCQSGTCNVTSGACPCKAGWTGTRCEVCALGFYNNNGTCSPCGTGCNDTCDTQTGECTCKPGWSPTRCLQMCESGKFGQDCNQTCAAGCDGVCDAITGNCSCRPQAPDCTGCKSGFWGGNCSLPCWNCAGEKRSCSQQLGECDSAVCVAGWTAPACKELLNHGKGDSTTGDVNTGSIIGAVVGTGVLLAAAILIAAILIRSRRSRGPRSSQTAEETGDRTRQERNDTERAPEAPISMETLSSGIVTYQPEQSAFGDSDHYDDLDRYENPVNIKPYTPLQPSSADGHTSRGQGTTAGDKNAYEIPDVQYENTKRK